MSKILWNLSFRLGLISLNVMSFKLIHVATQTSLPVFLTQRFCFCVLLSPFNHWEHQMKPLLSFPVLVVRTDAAASFAVWILSLSVSLPSPFPPHSLVYLFVIYLYERQKEHPYWDSFPRCLQQPGQARVKWGIENSIGLHWTLPAGQRAPELWSARCFSPAPEQVHTRQALRLSSADLPSCSSCELYVWADISWWS